MNSSPSSFKYSENNLVKKFQGYFYLMKPNVMILVIFTAFVGMMIAPGSVSPINYFFVLLSISSSNHIFIAADEPAPKVTASKT